MSQPVASKFSVEAYPSQKLEDLLIDNLHLKEKNNNWISAEARARQWARTVSQVAIKDVDKAQILYDEGIAKGVWTEYPDEQESAQKVLQDN